MSDERSRHRTFEYREKMRLMSTRWSDEDVFCQNSVVPKATAQKYFVKFMMRSGKYFCDSCPVGHSWNGKFLVLQCDHINGDTKDYRLENLRLLCPNCHTQTDTFGGKNAEKCKVKSHPHNSLERYFECFGRTR